MYIKIKIKIAKNLLLKLNKKKPKNISFQHLVTLNKIIKAKNNFLIKLQMIIKQINNKISQILHLNFKIQIK